MNYEDRTRLKAALTEAGYGTTNYAVYIGTASMTVPSTWDPFHDRSVNLYGDLGMFTRITKSVHGFGAPYVTYFRWMPMDERAALRKIAEIYHVVLDPPFSEKVKAALKPYAHLLPAPGEGYDPIGRSSRAGYYFIQLKARQPVTHEMLSAIEGAGGAFAHVTTGLGCSLMVYFTEQK